MTRIIADQFKLPAGSLASRTSAIPYRKRILTALKKEPAGIVVIDLSDVQVISGSFADECIAVLVKMIGLETVLHHVKLINGSPSVLNSIVSSIKTREQELKDEAGSDFIPDIA